MRRHELTCSSIQRGEGDRPINASRLCEVCGKTFRNKYHFNRHVKQHTGEKKFACRKCGRYFARDDNRKRHELTCIRETPVVEQPPIVVEPPLAEAEVEPQQEALNTFSVFTIEPSPDNQFDLITFLNHTRGQLRDILIRELEERKGVKFYIVVKVLFSRQTELGEIEYAEPFFRSRVEVLLSEDGLDDKIDTACNKILSSFDEYIKRLGLRKSVEVRHSCCVIYTPSAGLIYSSSSIDCEKESCHQHTE